MLPVVLNYLFFEVIKIHKYVSLWDIWNSWNNKKSSLNAVCWVTRYTALKHRSHSQKGSTIEKTWLKILTLRKNYYSNTWLANSYCYKIYLGTISVPFLCQQHILITRCNLLIIFLSSKVTVSCVGKWHQLRISTPTVTMQFFILIVLIPFSCFIKPP